MYLPPERCITHLRGRFCRSAFLASSIFVIDTCRMPVVTTAMISDNTEREGGRDLLGIFHKIPCRMPVVMMAIISDESGGEGGRDLL